MTQLRNFCLYEAQYNWFTLPYLKGTLIAVLGLSTINSNLSVQ
jgi:hypothetical protein